MDGETEAKIEQEVEFAKARWGWTRELALILRSRGLLPDREVLRLLRYFWLNGTAYAYVLARSRRASK